MHTKAAGEASTLNNLLALFNKTVESAWKNDPDLLDSYTDTKPGCWARACNVDDPTQGLIRRDFIVCRFMQNPRLRRPPAQIDLEFSWYDMYGSPIDITTALRTLNKIKSNASLAIDYTVTPSPELSADYSGEAMDFASLCQATSPPPGFLTALYTRQPDEPANTTTAMRHFESVFFNTWSKDPLVLGSSSTSAIGCWARSCPQEGPLTELYVCRIGNGSKPTSVNSWQGILSAPTPASDQVLQAINSARATAGAGPVAWDTNAAFEALAYTGKCSEEKPEPGVALQLIPHSQYTALGAGRFLMAVYSWRAQNDTDLLNSLYDQVGCGGRLCTYDGQDVGLYACRFKTNTVSKPIWAGILPSADPQSAQVLQAFNDMRAKAGAAPLAYSDMLARQALDFAATCPSVTQALDGDRKQDGYIVHTSPNPTQDISANRYIEYLNYYWQTDPDVTDKSWDSVGCGARSCKSGRDVGVYACRFAKTTATATAPSLGRRLR